MLSHGLCLCVLYFLVFNSNLFNLVNGDLSGGDTKVLTVGRKLFHYKGILALQGLKPNTLYQIPASFSIQLKKEGSNFGINQNRRLLNTEKLIFKTDSLTGEQRNLYILVSVEPEGIVAIPNVSERLSIVFNIVYGDPGSIRMHYLVMISNKFKDDLCLFATKSSFMGTSSMPVHLDM